MFPEVFKEFPNVQFYDYTKIKKRLYKDWYLPSNYHLTFSRSESNDRFCEELIREDFVPDSIRYLRQTNIAVVFQNAPKKWKERRVVVGDYTDLRFNDPSGVIIGLIPKGRAIKETSGFVVRL